MKEQRSICQAGPDNTPGRLCRVRLREWQEHASLAQQCFDTTDCSMRSLSRSSAGTLYHQILLELTDRIESGEIGVGDRLPSEADLVVEFGVSRTMARRALDELRRQSLVRREPGRGTFLASPRLRSNLAYLHSFSEEIERWGYTPGVWLVSREERIAGEEVAASLGVARGRGRGEGALRTEAEAGGQASDLRVRLAPAGDPLSHVERRGLRGHLLEQAV